jgi:hypothetical protein
LVLLTIGRQSTRAVERRSRRIPLGSSAFIRLRREGTERSVAITGLPCATGGETPPITHRDMAEASILTVRPIRQSQTRNLHCSNDGRARTLLAGADWRSAD